MKYVYHRWKSKNNFDESLSQLARLVTNVDLSQILRFPSTIELAYGFFPTAERGEDGVSLSFLPLFIFKSMLFT
jgi:hypothetical protein